MSTSTLAWFEDGGHAYKLAGTFLSRDGTLVFPGVPAEARRITDPNRIARLEAERQAKADARRLGARAQAPATVITAPAASTAAQVAAAWARIAERRAKA